MSVILAVVIVIVFAAIFVPPYVNPSHDVFQSSVSYDSPFGFVMHLEVNSTSLSPGKSLLLTGWINSSASSIEDINASSSWGFSEAQLSGKLCTSGWPIGLGLMKGHYTPDNYTLGPLVSLPRPNVACPIQSGAPQDFLLRPHSSEALVTINGTPQIWVIQSTLAISKDAYGNPLSPGVYTAVLADEWGDVVTAIFLVT